MKKFIITLYSKVNEEYEIRGYVGVDENYNFVRVEWEEMAFRFQSFSEAVIAKNIYLPNRNLQEFSIDEIEE